MANNFPHQDNDADQNNLMNSEEIIIELLTAFQQSYKLELDSFPEDVQKMVKYIHQHLFDQSLTVEEIKKSCAIVNHNVTSTFRQYLSVGPREYITRQKLIAAAEILSTTNVNIYLLAPALGYTEEGFSRIFKKIYGSTPMRYRKENGKKNG